MTALVILHLVGLMMGVTGSLGGTIALAFARPAQKQKGGALRGVGPAFAHVAMTGLALLWPTGIAMLAVSEGAGMATSMFWMKMAFVGLLSFATVVTEIAYSRARGGDPQIARLLPSLGPLAVLSYLMVVIFSVIAFR